MSKRNNGGYEQRPNDYWPTPLAAVQVLEGHLPSGFTFYEPCAGDGRLVKYIEELFDAHCFYATDVEPRADYIEKADASTVDESVLAVCEYAITNPPFKWVWVKDILDNLIPKIPCVMLLPADWLHNIRFGPYLEHVEKIVSVGRVKWIEDSKHSGVENFMWAFFTPEKTKGATFFGRKQKDRTS